MLQIVNRPGIPLTLQKKGSCMMNAPPTITDQPFTDMVILEDLISFWLHPFFFYVLKKYIIPQMM